MRVFLGRKKTYLLFFVVNRKKIHFSLNVSMRFRKNKTTLKMFSKTWSKEHIFFSYFSSFCANGKRMLTFFKINVLIDIILQTMNETVSFLRKTQFFVLGHVTLDVHR